MRRRWQSPFTVAVIVAAGCSVPGVSLESTPEVVWTSVAVAVREPVWSYRRHTLVGLTADGRVAEIADPHGHGSIRLSSPVGAGRNLQISRRDDRHVFVPQPQRGRVAVVDLDTLSEQSDFAAGPAPDYLSEDSGLRMLLAESRDGSSVTPVDEADLRALSTANIGGAPADTIGGANRGREIEYHVYGLSGIRYYRGTSSPPEEQGSLRTAVAAWAADGTAVTRSFVAGTDSNVLYAVDSPLGGEGMQVLAQTSLDSPARRIATDDTRVYAATDRNVVTLEVDSFTGFPHGAIPVLRTVDYRAALPASQRSARLSGIAVGPHRVYLTFAGTPIVVSVAKPRL